MAEELNIEKIFEDSSELVVKPLDKDSSCYYAANTKWCNQYDYVMDLGDDLYFFIDKKDGGKNVLFKPRNSDWEAYYLEGGKMTIKELKEKWPDQKELINKLTGDDDDFIKAVRLFTRGQLSANQLESLDDSILRIIEKDPLGLSTIVLDFEDDDKFFEALGLDEDDTWFVRSLFGRGYEFDDPYYTEENFKDGYLLNQLCNDESNKEKLKQIAEIVLSGEYFDLANNDYTRKLSNTLFDLFNRQIEYILQDYHIHTENELNTTAKEEVEKEITSALKRMGFTMWRDFDEVATTPGNILGWAARLRVTNIDVKSLFNQIVEESRLNLGGWMEDIYQFHNYENFDHLSFNKEVEKPLDDILEIIESQAEENGFSLEEFMEFRSRITKKYKPGVWYDLPKDSEVLFKIAEFIMDGMKIKIELHNRKNRVGDGHQFKTVSLSEKNFYNLLYHPQLFDLGEV